MNTEVDLSISTFWTSNSICTSSLFCLLWSLLVPPERTFPEMETVCIHKFNYFTVLKTWLRRGGGGPKILKKWLRNEWSLSYVYIPWLVLSVRWSCFFWSFSLWRLKSIVTAMPLCCSDSKSTLFARIIRLKISKNFAKVQ